MSRFELKEPMLHEEADDWKFGNDSKDMSSLLFFLNINYERDYDLAMTEDKPLPRAPEFRFNDLVFRAKHICPQENQAAFEIFEVTYDLGKNFDDKEEVHEALEIALKHRKRA